MATKTKVSDISKDMKQLRELLKQIPADRQAIAQSLYNELEFMQKTLETLKKQIDEEGPVSMFEQGAQKFLREHPALKGYNAMVQRYSLLYKQFTDLLPIPKELPKTDPLLDFLKNGKS
jgi:prefoldin subunit 5